MSSEEPRKVGERSFEEIAEGIYGQPSTPAVEVEEDQEETGELGGDPDIEESQESRDYVELAESIYPKDSPRVAKVLSNGQIATTIRDREGNILHGGENGSYPDVRDMVAYYCDALSNADLAGIDFAFRELKDARMAGADLSKCTFHGRLTWSDLSGSNLCGTNLKNCDLSYSDLSNAEFDGETDIIGANFTGAKYSFEAVKLCKNWKLAKGLRMGSDK